MKKDFDVFILLKISLSLMFIAIGIVGITNYNSDVSQFSRSINKLFGGEDNLFPIIFSIFELTAGIVLILTFFTVQSRNFISISLLIIFIVWAVSIVLTYFTNSFLKPDFIRWLANVTPQLVILSSLWILFRTQD